MLYLGIGLPSSCVNRWSAGIYRHRHRFRRHCEDTFHRLPRAVPGFVDRSLRTWERGPVDERISSKQEGGSLIRKPPTLLDLED